MTFACTRRAVGGSLDRLGGSPWRVTYGGRTGLSLDLTSSYHLCVDKRANQDSRRLGMRQRCCIVGERLSLPVSLTMTYTTTIPDMFFTMPAILCISKNNSSSRPSSLDLIAVSGNPELFLVGCGPATFPYRRLIARHVVLINGLTSEVIFG